MLQVTGIGVLKRGFTINTEGTAGRKVKLSIPAGVRVVGKRNDEFPEGVVIFFGYDDVYIFKVGKDFLACVYGCVDKLQPFNPRIPYPVSLIA